MDPSSIALQGLQQANIQVSAAATKIASADASSPDGTNLDVVDLSTEMVALMSAQSAFDVNLATLKTADQMQKSLLDLKA
jgi:flagellar basal body rod protein FlgG